MRFILSFFAIAWSGILFAQAPTLIPYQAIARDASGQPLANATLNARFTIHDNTATGPTMWQEIQTLSTSVLGLFTAQLGSSISLGNVNWAAGAKFMQIEIDYGNGFVDIGTQQMLSVPYALYSADALNSQNSQNAQTAGNGISGVSLTGDTLFLANGNFVIVPGISDANGPVEIFGCTSNSACNYNSAASIDDGSCYFVGSACDDADNNTYGDAFNSDCVCIGIPGGGGIGALVLPGNVTCADEYISVSGCNGETSITYDGRDYDLVEIGGQCWFAENLATSHYRNGDAISTGLSNADWENTDITQQGAYVVYDNDINNDLIYGKLYNWYAVTDPRGLCPSGWHVPSDCEWMYLEGSLGLSVEEQQSINFRGVQVGGSMKTTGTIESGSGLWLSPNLGATNSSGFSAIPSGYIGANGATFYLKGNSGFWWSRTPTAIGNTTAAIVRVLSRNLSSINRSTNFGTQPGTAVRCVRD